jgi:glycogen synthase
LPSVGLSDDLFTPEGVEFYGHVSFMKAGIQFSDAITTVSPSYAREILTPEYGCGLDGLLRRRTHEISGILNGVDYGIWNPAEDPQVPAHFEIGDMSGKRVCKAELQRELGLDVDARVPIVAWLSRIIDQKMADVVCHALHLILARDVQVALLGEGDHRLEAKFLEAAQHYPGRLAVRIARITCGETRGRLRSFGDHVLIRRQPRVKWMEFSEATAVRISADIEIERCAGNPAEINATSMMHVAPRSAKPGTWWPSC